VNGLGSLWHMLSKRGGSPFWWVSFIDSNGKRRRKSTKCLDKRAASKVAAEMVAETAERSPNAKAGMLFEILGAQYADLSHRLDAIDARLGRIEKQLDIIEATEDTGPTPQPSGATKLR
jgi:hypothetical protein